MNNEGQAKQIITELKEAIKKENKAEIVALFDRAELIDWHDVYDSVFTTYDALVDRANDILLTD